MRLWQLLRRARWDVDTFFTVFLGQRTKSFQRFGADVMFNSLGVDGSDSLRDADGEQEMIHQLVPFLGLSSKAGPLFCQHDGPVWLGIDKPFLFETADDFCHRNMADCKSFGQIDDAAVPSKFLDFRDRFDIVLRSFGGVVLSRPTMSGCNPV